MLFLGAGASAPFGISTMQKLTEDVSRLLKDKGFEDEYRSIASALTRFNLTPDFEGIFAVLNAWTDPTRTIHELGPFAAVMANELNEAQIRPKKEFRELILEIKKLLVQKCRNPNMSAGVQTYDKLFETLATTGDVLVRPNQRTGLQTGNFIQVPGRPRLRTQDTFTLNYDLVIERYFAERGIGDNLCTGFTPRGMEFVYRPEAYTYASGKTNLIKLHGSIDQFFRKDTIEKAVAPPEASYYTKEVLGEMMIYPVQEKYVTRNPYFQLYSLLRHWLATDVLCIIIGYSFRDEAVNNAFIDGLSSNANLKMIYVSPNASRDILNLGNAGRRIHCMDRKFGEDEILGELKNAIENWLP